MEPLAITAIVVVVLFLWGRSWVFPPERKLLMFCTQKFAEAQGAWCGAGEPLGEFLPKAGLIHILRSRYPSWTVEQALELINANAIEGPWQMALVLCKRDMPERLPRLMAYLEWKAAR